MKSESGSQISVNFMDLDLHEPDFENNCNTEYLMIKERLDSPFSLVGSTGRKFCGQWLPNYPGPSVMLSSKYLQISSSQLSLMISLQVRMSSVCPSGRGAQLGGRAEGSSCWSPP